MGTKSRISWILLVFTAAGCLQGADPTAQTQSLKPGGWGEAEPYATFCPPAKRCEPINGTCSDSCVLTCFANFHNCDGDDVNGCECGSAAAGSCTSDTCNGNSCPGAKPAGTPCERECHMNTQCSANGFCEGTPAADGTFCSKDCAPDEDPMCKSATCKCVKTTTTTPPPPPCSFSPSGTMAGMAPLLALLGLTLFLRRRRRA
jgi:MYXO-CTERM domain-containing protein